MKTSIFNSIQVCMLICTASIAFAGNNYYIEDFSSKQYCDTTVTTARWDTISGELSLYPFLQSAESICSTPGATWGLTINGWYAYIADGHYGIQVVDINDQSSPSIVGYSDTYGSAVDVAVSGNYLFVADYDSGLVVISIEDPTTPSIVGRSDTTFYALDVVVEGNYAYVAGRYAGLWVLDIHNPENPTHIDSSLCVSEAYAVDIDGSYAYVSEKTGGISVFDISDPYNVARVAYCYTPGESRGITVFGDYLYLAGRLSGLHIIDISDPLNPIHVGSCDTPGQALHVCVDGPYAYVSDYAEGIQTIDISDPASPDIINCYYAEFLNMMSAIDGEFLYSANYDAGLEIIRIMELNSDCKVLSSIASSEPGMDVAISGNNAYIANSALGLRVVDISNVADIEIIGECGYEDCLATGVVLRGDYAYVSIQHFSHNLQVIDISEPSSPTVVGTNFTDAPAADIAIDGKYAYLATDDGLQVVDISNPLYPSTVRSIDTPGVLYSIAISGDCAYVGGQYGLDIYDITIPMFPLLIGSSYLGGGAKDIFISGDRAAIATGDGMIILDISDPSDLSYMGGFTTLYSSLAVFLWGEYTLLSTDVGTFIVEIIDPGSPPHIVELIDGYGGYAFSIYGDCLFCADGTSVWLSNRAHDLSKNTAQSIPIDSETKDVMSVRFSSIYSDSIQWAISANGGISWQGVVSQDAWQDIENPGHELLWRASLICSDPGMNPSCSRLELKWLYSCGLIDSIVDISNDQGGYVRVIWTRSHYDSPESDDVIKEYSVFRRSDDYPFVWDSLITVPAHCEEYYSCVLPTLGDSTATGGILYTTYYVKAKTLLGDFYDSPLDSGYSIDNIGPSAPTELLIVYNALDGTRLTWNACVEPDLAYYRIYRDDHPDFIPNSENFVFETAETTWIDAIADGWRYSYYVTAVDQAGNESETASAEYITGEDAPSVPLAFALHQNVPNPFNPSTRISFDLPERTKVVLQIFSVTGGLVRTLVNGKMDRGYKEVLWNGVDNNGESVSSGIYFYRLTACAFTQTRKMVLVR